MDAEGSSTRKESALSLVQAELKRAVSELGVPYLVGWQVERTEDDDLKALIDYKGARHESLEAALEAIRAHVRAERGEEAAKEDEEDQTAKRRRRTRAFSRWSSTGKEEAVGEDEEVQDFKKITFSAKDVNAHLVCRLCDGYFRDAHTITECLHTFCKACLLKYLDESKAVCPHCKVNLGPHPKNTILHDRTMQTLCDKICRDEPPELEQPVDKPPTRRSRQPASAAKRPPPTPRPAPTPKTKSPPAAPAPVAAPAAAEPPAVEGAGQISFKVVPSDADANLPVLDKPYLKTSGKLKVSQLRRYLAKKLNIPGSSLDLLCLGDPLSPDLSLSYIRRYNWWGNGVGDLVVNYRKIG